MNKVGKGKDRENPFIKALNEVKIKQEVFDIDPRLEIKDKEDLYRRFLLLHMYANERPFTIEKARLAEVYLDEAKAKKMAVNKADTRPYVEQELINISKYLKNHDTKGEALGHLKGLVSSYTGAASPNSKNGIDNILAMLRAKIPNAPFKIAFDSDPDFITNNANPVFKAKLVSVAPPKHSAASASPASGASGGSAAESKKHGSTGGGGSSSGAGSTLGSGTGTPSVGLSVKGLVELYEKGLKKPTPPPVGTGKKYTLPSKPKAGGGGTPKESGKWGGGGSSGKGGGGGKPTVGGGKPWGGGGGTGGGGKPKDFGILPGTVGDLINKFNGKPKPFQKDPLPLPKKLKIPVWPPKDPDPLIKGSRSWPLPTKPNTNPEPKPKPKGKGQGPEPGPGPGPNPNPNPNPNPKKIVGGLSFIPEESTGKSFTDKVNDRRQKIGSKSSDIDRLVATEFRDIVQAVFDGCETKIYNLQGEDLTAEELRAGSGYQLEQYLKNLQDKDVYNTEGAFIAAREANKLTMSALVDNKKVDVFSIYTDEKDESIKLVLHDVSAYRGNEAVEATRLGALDCLRATSQASARLVGKVFCCYNGTTEEIPAAKVDLNVICNTFRETLDNGVLMPWIEPDVVNRLRNERCDHPDKQKILEINDLVDQYQNANKPEDKAYLQEKVYDQYAEYFLTEVFKAHKGKKGQ